MIITSQRANGHIDAATSDDGRINIPLTPMTSLYGEFRLIDAANGRDMHAGRYIDADGLAADAVPAEIWAQARALMHEINAHNFPIEEAAQQRSRDEFADRLVSWSNALAMDMDRADSDN